MSRLSRFVFCPHGQSSGAGSKSRTPEAIDGYRRLCRFAVGVGLGGACEGYIGISNCIYMYICSRNVIQKIINSTGHI